MTTMKTRFNTRLGAIEGLRDEDVHIFQGIRFGTAPTGKLRFQAARPADSWPGTLDASSAGNRSLQPVPTGKELFALLSRRDIEKETYDEDCLFLNIYTPASAGKRPVMVWIHGGGFSTGSGSEHYGDVLAGQGDVVVVTINYRVGLLGFMDMSAYGDQYQGSASNGISDQILALEWVRDNIADYGGDAGNVTIFGCSAGGSSVNCLLAAPVADGLYHKAISHSGTSPTTAPAEVAPLLAKRLKVATQDLPAQLASMTGPEIFQAQLKLGARLGACIDGSVVTRTRIEAFARLQSAGVPYIAGSNRDEGTAFSTLMPDDPNRGNDVFGPVAIAAARRVIEDEDPSDYLTTLQQQYPNDDPRTLYGHILTDSFRCAAIRNVEAATAAGFGGWLYRFDIPSNAMDGKLGAAHGAEMSFTFNTYASREGLGLVMHDRDDPEIQALAKAWSQTLINFTRSGTPNGGGLPQWQAYNETARQSLVLDLPSYIVGAELDLQIRTRWGDL
jgi:para-nitrobenzyl esterase